MMDRLADVRREGGEPQQFGLSVEAFHQRAQDRQRDWPAPLLGTSPHDTKRSEDERARMVAISDVPQLWRQSLQRWRVMNRPWKKRIDHLDAPDPDEEYLMNQT